MNSAKDLLQTRFKIGVALHAGLVSRAAGLLAFPDMSNKKWAYSNSEISHLHLRWVSPAAGWKTLVLGGALGLGGVCPRHGPRETPPGAGCGPEDPFLCYSTAPQDCTAGLHRSQYLNGMSTMPKGLAGCNWLGFVVSHGKRELRSTPLVAFKLLLLCLAAVTLCRVCCSALSLVSASSSASSSPAVSERRRGL